MGHWLLYWTGIGDESGYGYGFWSGIGSCLAYGGAIAALLRHHNCEVRRCWRLGRHQTDGGHHVCRRHMPGGAPSHQDVIDAHQAASARAETA